MTADERDRHREPAAADDLSVLLDADEANPLALELAAAVERLRRVAGLIWERIETDFELTPLHAHALEAISGGAHHVSSVADVCGRHVSSASRFVDSLVARGLVDRAADPDDRRAVRLSLTDAGHSMIERIEQAQAAMLSRIVAHLGHDEAQQLVRLLERTAQSAEVVLDNGLMTGADA